MPRSYSNARCLRLVHSAWTLVAAVAFGLGYLMAPSRVTNTHANPETSPARSFEKSQPFPDSPSITAQVAPIEKDPAKPPPRQDPGNFASNRSERFPVSEPTAPDIHSLPDIDVTFPEKAVPPRGTPLRPEEAHKLLTGTVIFNPSAIPSSNIPVAPSTPLSVGQHLQVKYGNTWWAGTVRGIEPDGRIRVHYFGWADSYDELKAREELQLDNTAPVKALDTAFVRQGR